MITTETALGMDTKGPKATEPTPVASEEAGLPTTSNPPASTTTPTTQNPTLAGHADAAPKVSTSADTTGRTSPPFTPSSTTPVLEKEELDFVGNVDVNDNLPTDQDLQRVNDLLVLDAHGQSRPFKDLYAGEGVAPKQLIIFVRHFFCGNCQEFLRTLSSSITPESLLALSTPTFITVIGCGRPELIDMYVQTTSCPFPVYADPTRKLYDLLGMTRTLDLGKKPSYIQSNLFVTSVQSIVQGLKTGHKALKGGDFKQVGGEFLFEDGKCVWVHRMKNTRDHSEVEQVRALVGLESKKPPLRKRWSHGIKEIKDKDGRGRSSSWGRMRSKSRGLKDKEKGQSNSSPKESAELQLNGRPTV